MTTEEAGYGVHVCTKCGKTLVVLDEKKVFAPNAAWRYMPYMTAHATCGTEGCTPWIFSRRIIPD